MKPIIHIFFCLYLHFHLIGQLDLIAKVNGSNEDSIVAGIPVMIHVQLANLSDEHNLMNNLAIKQNLAHLEQLLSLDSIDQKYFDDEHSRLSNLISETIGIAVNPADLKNTIAIRFDNKTLNPSNWMICMAEGADETLIISRDIRLSWFLGIPSKTTSNWEAGNHKLVIQLDSIHSKTMNIYIDPDPSPDVNMLIAAGYFEMDCGDPMEAQRIANTILEINPNSIDAHVILADSQLAQELESEALNMYRTALQMFYDQFPKSPEPPDYLLQQIGMLENRPK